MSLTMELVIAAVLMSLILMVEHWFPMAKYFRKPMGILTKYVGGIIAIMIPYVFLLVMWKSWDELITIGTLVFVAGIVTGIMHWVDRSTEDSHRATAAEGSERTLKDGTLS